MAEPQQIGMVYLVGAGPGDPGLLTLRGVECLRAAQLVICDQLVNPRLLEHAPQAEHAWHSALHEDRASRHAHLVERMVSAARAGLTVVRLKGGDPGIFGRLTEEVAALAAAGVPFEIVPGVTAGAAAGACAGIPLTQRTSASAVAFVTGHECTGESKPSLDWQALARFPGTLVVYMGLARFKNWTAELIGQGKKADTPVAVVRWASTGRQITLTGTLGDIAQRASEAGLRAPAVVIVGDVVNNRVTKSWHESRPLFGRTVLVTRPREQAAGMMRELELLGAVACALPVVEIGPAPDLAAVDWALARLHEFDWLVFTSANGVRALLERLLAGGRDLRDLGRLRLAAIGPRTAAALAAYHLRADLTPNEFSSEGLIAALTPYVHEQRVLLARADRGREMLFAELQGLCAVEQVAVYSQIDAVQANPAVLAELRAGAIDYVTLTSANIARAFVHLLDDESRQHLGRRTQLVTISPITSATVRELGFDVAAEAVEFTTTGVLAALQELERDRPGREL